MKIIIGSIDYTPTTGVVITFRLVWTDDRPEQTLVVSLSPQEIPNTTPDEWVRLAYAKALPRITQIRDIVARIQDLVGKEVTDLGKY